MKRLVNPSEIKGSTAEEVRKQICSEIEKHGDGYFTAKSKSAAVTFFIQSYSVKASDVRESNEVDSFYTYGLATKKGQPEFHVEIKSYYFDPSFDHVYVVKVTKTDTIALDLHTFAEARAAADNVDNYEVYICHRLMDGFGTDNILRQVIDLSCCHHRITDRILCLYEIQEEDGFKKLVIIVEDEYES